MKYKILALVALGIAFFLNACSPLTVVRSSGLQPTPEQDNIASEVDIMGITTNPVPPATPTTSVQDNDEMIFIEIDHVEVEVGIGSPLPVEIVVSGTWPDLCAQIAEVHSTINDFKIEVTLLASTVIPCRPDYLGLPFLFRIPLNIGELLEGVYTITVNGASTTLNLPIFP